MTKRILLLSLLLTSAMAWAETHYPGLQVEVARDGSLYNFSARFDTSLSKCAAYHYLTDYEAAKNLPGVLESLSERQSANKVRVERIADEQVLFFHVRLHSVMEYTEKPFDSIAFIQLKGDSKVFQGNWVIEPNPQGSTLRFRGVWEPDTLIPLFIIDHFAKNGLFERFDAIAQLAEKRKNLLSSHCESPLLATIGE
jgi:hypothetical protein